MCQESYDWRQLPANQSTGSLDTMSRLAQSLLDRRDGRFPRESTNSGLQPGERSTSGGIAVSKGALPALRTDPGTRAAQTATPQRASPSDARVGAWDQAAEQRTLSSSTHSPLLSAIAMNAAI